MKLEEWKKVEEGYKVALEGMQVRWERMREGLREERERERKRQGEGLGDEVVLLPMKNGRSLFELVVEDGNGKALSDEGEGLSKEIATTPCRKCVNLTNNESPYVTYSRDRTIL